MFSFVDAGHLIAKAHLWKERDDAIQKKYEKLNNDVLPKVASDKLARIGCKGKEKYCYSYKKHASVDMFRHAKPAVFNRLCTALIPNVAVYGSDYIDKIPTGILQDMIAEIA